MNPHRLDFLPVVISIDCEPDPRVTPSAGPPPWRGLDELIRIVGWWRKQVPGARLGWYWRNDAQVEHGHGDPGWALHTYRSHIKSTGAAGDEHGLHLHLWRWSERESTWVADAADEAWVESSMQRAIDNYRTVMRRPVRAMRMGDRHTSPLIQEVLNRNAVDCDLTLEPGAPAMAKLAASELATGMIADQSTVPRRPFQPSREDPCREAGAGESGVIWALPLTTAPAGLPGIGQGTSANLGFSPATFRRIVQSGLSESIRQQAPYVSVVARSDVGAHERLAGNTVQNLAWLATAGAGFAPPKFMGPIEALQALVSQR